MGALSTRSAARAPTAAWRDQLYGMVSLLHVEYILDAARIAPSNKNMQPRRFAEEGDTISLSVDHERDRSPANADGRMARIAVGAALECALLRAGRMGATVRFETPRPNALITSTVGPPKRMPGFDKALVRRVTNRRLYDGRPLDDTTFSLLHEATGPLDSTRTLWFGRERVRVLGPIFEQAEVLFLSNPSAREHMLRAIRLDARDREEVLRGLSSGSLELSTADRLALDVCRMTTDRVATSGAFAPMGARARRLVESASGVCVLVTRGTEPSTDVTIGRCMQRAWLLLTRRGLVAQPMSTVSALEAMLDVERGGGPAVGERQRVEDLVAKVRAAFPSVERTSRIGLILRVGWAPPPTARVRRLALQDSLAAAAETSVPPNGCGPRKHVSTPPKSLESALAVVFTPPTSMARPPRGFGRGPEASFDAPKPLGRAPKPLGRAPKPRRASRAHSAGADVPGAPRKLGSRPVGLVHIECTFRRPPIRSPCLEASPPARRNELARPGHAPPPSKALGPREG